MLYYIITVISIIIAICLYIATLVVWLKGYKKDSPDMKWALKQYKSAQDSKSRYNIASRKDVNMKEIQ